MLEPQLHYCCFGIILNYYLVWYY